MNNPDKFLQEILDFKGETIDETILANVNKIILDPAMEFTEDNIRNKNLAASKICLWIVCITTFNKIYKEVKPLDEAQKKASETVATKEKELAQVKERVRILNEKVAALQRQLAEAETVKREVEE